MGKQTTLRNRRVLRSSATSSSEEEREDIDEQPSSTKQYYIDISFHPIQRRIHFYRGISHSEMSAAIHSCFQLHLKPNQLPTAVHGVFLQEQKNLITFHPFSHIAAFPDMYQQHVYHLVDPTPKVPKPTLQHQIQGYLPWIAKALLVVIVLYTLGFLQTIVALIKETLIGLFTVAIELPLKQLYRYGPSVSLFSFGEFGFWQGRTLPQICSRMTQQDASFWARNIEECKDIYKAKEFAFVMMIQTIAYMSFIVWFFKYFLGFSSSKRGGRR